MVYVLVLSMIAGALALYYYLFKDFNFFKRNGVPHLTPLPVLGNMASTAFYRQSMADFVKEAYDMYPEAKYVGTYDFTRPLLMLRDPELIKSIALKHFDMFPDHRTFVTEEQEPLFAKNLSALVGDRWRQMRTILSPAFTSSKMKSMYKLMSTCGADFADFLAHLPSEKRAMEMKDVVTRYANDVIATCAFGISVDSMRNPKNEFYIYGREATSFFSTSFLKFFMFFYFPWLARMMGLEMIRKEVGIFFRDLVETTIKTRDEKGIVRPDMLQLMMETRSKEGEKKLSIEDMVSQAFIFFLGGFESTSTLMSFAIHEIAVNRDVQDRLQNEIDQVLEDTKGEASYEAVNSMEYLDAVINEALRMYPVAVATDRLCVNELELPPALPGMKPFTARKGLSISIPIYALQHDPKYFDEPEKFDPDRFLGDKKKDIINSGAYLPFGLGPRMCIGNRFALLETKVLLFHLLARCDLNVCEKTSLPLKLIKGGFNMKPEGGFWLSVVPRKNPHHSIAVANGNISNSKRNL